MAEYDSSKFSEVAPRSQTRAIAPTITMAVSASGIGRARAGRSAPRSGAGPNARGGGGVEDPGAAHGSARARVFFPDTLGFGCPGTSRPAEAGGRGGPQRLTTRGGPAGTPRRIAIVRGRK